MESSRNDEWIPAASGAESPFPSPEQLVIANALSLYLMDHYEGSSCLHFIEPV